MLDKGKLKKIKKQNEINNAKIKSFNGDSSQIYKFKIAQLKNEKAEKIKYGYNLYTTQKEIENNQAKLNAFENRVNEQKNKEELAKKFVIQKNKKGGIVKTKKK
jgi:hypothetical protein